MMVTVTQPVERGRVTCAPSTWRLVLLHSSGETSSLQGLAAATSLPPTQPRVEVVAKCVAKYVK